MKPVVIKGDTMFEVSEDLARTQKMFPCAVCKKIFSWDEKRVDELLPDGSLIWRHPYCVALVCATCGRLVLPEDLVNTFHKVCGGEIK